MNPVLTRFSAAAAVCALVLTGAAVWRALSPPGLDDLRDVTGDPEYKNKHLASVQRL